MCNTVNFDLFECGDLEGQIMGTHWRTAKFTCHRARAILTLVFITATIVTPLSVEASDKQLNSPIGAPFWEPSRSDWLLTERNTASNTLRGRRADILVTPVQGGENTFDAIERSLITHLITDAIANSTSSVVANSSFVIRYLGLNRYHYSQDEINEIANASGANSIVTIQASYEEIGSFTLTANVIDKVRQSTVRSREWTNLSFSDDEPPVVAIRKILDELVEFSAGAKLSLKPRRFDLDIENMMFGESIDDFTSAAQESPLASAAYLQLLGMLHPRGSFNESRNDLFERSLVELYKVSPGSPNYNYLLARAFAYLDRRPAAISIIGKPNDIYERALLAALNGDLPTLRNEIALMPISAFSLMSWRDLLEIESRYRDQRVYEELEQFYSLSQAWGPFIYRSLIDSSLWANFSPLTPKVGLDLLLPTKVSTAESFLASSSATDEIPSEKDLSELLWEHIGELEVREFPDWAKDPSISIRPSRFDVVNLARSVGTANHLRRIEDHLSKRGSAEAAIRDLAVNEIRFAGHPAVTLMKARALTKLAQSSNTADGQSMRRQASVLSLNGFAWTGQLTADALLVADLYESHLRDNNIDVPHDDNQMQQRLREEKRVGEWPRSSEWHVSMFKTEATAELLDICLNYTWTKFDCLDYRLDTYRRSIDMRIGGNPQRFAPHREKFLSGYRHRFAGHPSRVVHDIQTARLAPDIESEVQQLRTIIDSGATQWAIYYELGRTLKRNGDYSAAQEVFLSYPKFREFNSNNALGNSNNAYDAGSMLYWIGQYELAIPLFELSANSGTNSAGDYASAARIALIERDFESAAQFSAQRVRQYGSNYAIRDLQQILHLLGASDSAWSIFDQAQSGNQDAQMWSGALVGHRRSAASIDDVAAWLSESDARKTAHMRDPVGSDGRISLAQRYIFMHGTMDRIADQKLLDTMAKFRYRTPQTYKLSTLRSQPNAKPIGSVRQGRASYRKDDLIHAPASGYPAEDGEIIPLRFEMLAEAMMAFHEADHQAAFEAFDRTARFYLLDEYLPYYAFSAALTNNAEHLPAALARRERGFQSRKFREKTTESDLGYRFDEDLTTAVLAGLDGKHVRATEFLNRALNNRPYIEERTVYPYYQVVEMAILLYRQTDKIAYKELALDLARRHTVVLPMYAWAHFVVAKLSSSELERIESAASGFYLDPLSHRGTQLPPDVVRAAKAHLTNHGAPLFDVKQTAFNSDPAVLEHIPGSIAAGY